MSDFLEPWRVSTVEPLSRRKIRLWLGIEKVMSNSLQELINNKQILK